MLVELKIDLDKVRTIAILGDRETGKTNLLFFLAKNYKGDKNVVLYAYPRSHGYQRIYSLEDLSSIKNSVVFMDELQRHLPLYQKRMNEQFLELLGVLAHNNNVLVFNTGMSHFITKALDGFLDCFIYTRIRDLGTLKNGSRAKRLLQQNSFQEISSWSVNVPLGKCLVIGDEKKGVFDFKDMGIKKDWQTE